MTRVALENHQIAGPLGRAESVQWDEDTATQLEAALAAVDAQATDVLELSRARWGNEENGPDEVLVVLMREVLVLVGAKKSRLLGRSRAVLKKPLSDYVNAGEDDEFFGHSVFIFGRDEDDTFLLAWPGTAERHRMFEAIFDALQGRYERWGLQLDPSNYAADFDAYYAELVAEGPPEAIALGDWVAQRHGEFDISNALGLASEWRRAELSDAAGREPSARVMRVGSSELWADVSPEARGVVVRLGEQLADAGLLDPPYDEKTFATEEGLSRVDAGPSRLAALMTLAALASSQHHPRSTEWVEAARQGIPTVPPSILSPRLRDLWADI